MPNFKKRLVSKAALRPIKNPAIGRNRYNGPRDHLAAFLKGFDGSMFQTAAARNLHADNGDAFDIILTNDFGQLFGIIHTVQLRTAHKGDMSLDEFSWKAA